MQLNTVKQVAASLKQTVLQIQHQTNTVNSLNTVSAHQRLSRSRAMSAAHPAAIMTYNNSNNNNNNNNKKLKSFLSHKGPQGGADLHFCSRQPDTS